MVGRMMSAMVCTRPDIGYVVEVVSQYMSNPGREHWAVMKWILLYLRGTVSVCLWFGSRNPTLEDYMDSNMSANADTSRSMSGYIMTYAWAAVSWQSSLQKAMVLSTTEAEYMAAAEAGM